MRISFAVAILTATICIAIPAQAGIVIHGPSLGHDCYEATLPPPDHARDITGVKLCDRALDEDSVDQRTRAAIYINRSDLKLRLKDYEGAIADARKGIALVDVFGEAYANLGAGMIGLQRYEEAIVALDQAMTRNGDKVPAIYFDRGLAKENLGDIKGAYLDYKQASLLDPDFQRATDQLKRFMVVTHPQ